MIYVYCYLAGDTLALADDKRCEICEGDCEVPSEIVLKALALLDELDD